MGSVRERQERWEGVLQVLQELILVPFLVVTSELCIVTLVGNFIVHSSFTPFISWSRVLRVAEYVVRKKCFRFINNMISIWILKALKQMVYDKSKYTMETHHVYSWRMYFI